MYVIVCSKNDKTQHKYFSKIIIVWWTIIHNSNHKILVHETLKIFENKTRRVFRFFNSTNKFRDFEDSWNNSNLFIAFQIFRLKTLFTLLLTL